MAKPQLRDFVKHGGLPKELPYMFSFSSYSSVVHRRAFRTKLREVIEKQRESECCDYSYPKGAAGRRQLSLPNPAFQVDLMKSLLKNWPRVVKELSCSPYSVSTPQIRDDLSKPGRFVEPRTRRGSVFQVHLGHSTKYKVLLEVDISHFYPSIYTHSIEWAMVGRGIAKDIRARRVSNATLKRLHELGSELDQRARVMRSRETVGLPVGPDTSFVLAELVASRLDREIETRLSSLGFFGRRVWLSIL